MMTLAYLRSIGIHSVALDCECGHSEDVNVDHLPETMGVPDARFEFWCSRCRRRPWRSMPCWHHQDKVPGVPDSRRRSS